MGEILVKHAATVSKIEYESFVKELALRITWPIFLNFKQPVEYKIRVAILVYLSMAGLIFTLSVHF